MRAEDREEFKHDRSSSHLSSPHEEPKRPASVLPGSLIAGPLYSLERAGLRILRSGALLISRDRTHGAQQCLAQRSGSPSH